MSVQTEAQWTNSAGVCESVTLAQAQQVVRLERVREEYASCATDAALKSSRKLRMFAGSTCRFCQRGL